MTVIIPPALTTGDTVGIIAPSEGMRDIPAPHSRGAHGVTYLESLGLKVKFAPHIHDTDFWGGATPEKRAQDLHDLWDDPEVKMIMMCFGGQYAHLLLDHLDFERLKKTPKIFSGMSDGTILTSAIYQKCNIMTYNGTNLYDSLGYPLSPMMAKNFEETFRGDGCVTITENPDQCFHHWSDTPQDMSHIHYSGWAIIRAGHAQGHSIAGLMSRLITLDYVGYRFNYEKAILFIEGVTNFKDFCLELIAMKQRGIFEQINGLVLGYFCFVDNQEDVGRFALDILSEYDFPIVKIAEYGHFAENYNFPIGAKTSLNTDTKTITFER